MTKIVPLALIFVAPRVQGDDKPKVTTGITWDSPETEDGELETDRLNFKSRTTVQSLAELERFLNDQLIKDEMSVVVSFFEQDQIINQHPGYLKFLRAGGIPENAMMAFGLCTEFKVARALKIPPPLPRTVYFSPKEDHPGEFEMRQAKFFESGQVFLDGVLPVLATVVSGEVPTVEFPSSVREAVLGKKAAQDENFESPVLTENNEL
eukprot:CAMPEP_0172597106 /NCGR_PEP_ID=MMETSP1068-20121228/17054_1 /TAXON_ID=35684 /ORGANISM="Pseudopedinella elastica, Strain CCMP716" /LENGTH=207 /DNA_ID=CAMNT_0013396473 /DNA_START=46 /DNA_END=669 /DNA_ORIENTATION=+